MTRLRLIGVAATLILGGLLSASMVCGSELRSSYAAPPPAPEYHNPLREAMRVDLDVLVDGQPVKLIPYEGRLYLPVPRMGAEYAIRVTNHGSRRMEAVVSVDGLSVINGRPASEKSVGYLVNARSSITIKGWRRDKDTVAAFSFENREDSYAARMGYRDNIGVIGLVAFEEQTARALEDVPMTFGLSRDTRGSTAPGGTGTGWGRDIGSSVVEVPFVRSANKRTVTIYYDTAEALRRIGVPVDGGNPSPKPFPVDTEFAPPPPPKR